MSTGVCAVHNENFGNTKIEPARPSMSGWEFRAGPWESFATIIVPTLQNFSVATIHLPSKHHYHTTACQPVNITTVRHYNNKKKTKESFHFLFI